MTNNGNASASFSWLSKGAFTVSPESGTVNPCSSTTVEVVWTPQPGYKTSENLILKVEGGKDTELPVSGRLAESRCKFLPPETARQNANPNSNPNSAPAVSRTDKGGGRGGGGVLDFGQVSVGVERTLKVCLQNVGKTKAVFWVESGVLDQCGVAVEPIKGLIQPNHTVELVVTLIAKRELRLDGITLCANIRGGRPAKLQLAGIASIPIVNLLQDAFSFEEVTMGATETLHATLSNQGPIPALLQLDLSRRPEFHLVEEGTGGGGGRGGGVGVAEVVARQSGVKGGGLYPRTTDAKIGIEDGPWGGPANTSSEPPAEMGVGSSTGIEPAVRKWNITVAAGDTLSFLIMFRPHQASEHLFPLPLALRGIPGDGRLQAMVSGRGLKPVLTFSSMEVDFGDQVVSRDPCMLKPYQGEVTFLNDSKQGLSWVMDDSALRVEDNEDMPLGATKTPTFYVSPTSGELSPGEETRVRVTFTPKSDRDYTFHLPVWLARRLPSKGTRPYLKLTLQGFGVYPRLSFSHTEVVMPVVPLHLTSRATFHVINRGFTDMEVTHRLPLHCPVDMAINFPEGEEQLGAGTERIPVEVSFRSSKPVSFSCVLDIFDADGGHYPIKIAGCADNCLLTNFPFVEAYKDRFQFWVREGKAVQFMDGAQIKAEEAKEFKERMSKRAKAKARTHAKANNGSGTVPATDSVVASTVSDVDGGSGGRNDEGDAGIDLSLPPYPAGGDEEDARVLAAWLTATVVTNPVKEFPRSIIEAHGAPAFEAIEIMSGRRVPGQAWQRVKHRAEDRVVQLIGQYRQMLRFLKEKGCLLNSVRPEALLDRSDYIRGRRLEALGATGSGGSAGGAQRMTPSQLRELEEQWGQEWPHVSREAWTSVMYQSIRSFMLSRVTPKALSAVPGVFISMPREVKGKGGTAKATQDPEMTGSNVYSVGEGVLLKWMSYHLEQANKTSIARRVTTFDDDFKDGAVLCQLIASHAPYLTEKGFPLHNFIPVHSTGELSDFSNCEANASKFLSAMTTLRMGMDLRTENILQGCAKNGVLLALHLFQALPQVIPKTDIEFRATLGAAVEKSIELHNPGSKGITYEATLHGSPDFKIKASKITLEAGKAANFPVELRPRFSSPVDARLTLWAVRTNGAMAPASNMVFILKSKVDSILARETKEINAVCYEHQTVVLEVSNPFESKARSSADGRFSLQLRQSVTSEHPCLAGLSSGGPGGASRGRRRSGSLSKVPSQAPSGVISKTDSTSTVGRGLGKGKGAEKGAKGKERNGKAEAGEEDKAVRQEVETALRLPFYTDQASISIPTGSKAKLSLQLLPFFPGEYKCTIMFRHDRLGEFAYEVNAIVDLPVPLAILPLWVPAEDMSGGAIQRELMLPSKNPTLQNALYGVLLERFQSDRKTRARHAIVSLSAPMPEAAAGGSQEMPVPFSIEVDSPFFQLNRETVALTMEVSPGSGGGTGGGGETGSSIGGGPGGVSARGAGGGGTGAGKRKGLPKQVELVDPQDRVGGGEAGTKIGGVRGSVSMPPPLADTNVALLNFFPKAAGTYPCQILVIHRTKHLVDVRRVDVAATVDAPRSTTALVFRAPAGQKITQEVPIHNNGDTPWSLNAGQRQPPFGGPNVLVVPPRGKAMYPLTFAPVRFSPEEVLSKLVLTDTKDRERPVRFEFELRGTAEEPLAESHRVLKCSARERVHETNNNIWNPLVCTGSPAVSYAVESDLPGVSGEPTILVPAKGEAEYSLSLCPQFSGVFTGSLTFTGPAGAVTWFTVEVQTSNPLEEDVVAITTVLRQAVSVEICLANPLDEDLEFQVFLEGEGLMGDATFPLGPLESATYTLYYSPMRVQSHTGKVTFATERVGEFWYKLDLRADPAPPIRLDTILCPAGAREAVDLSIDNPMGQEVVLVAKSSNKRNFSVEPGQIAIGPYGTSPFQVIYTPSSLGEEEFGEVILSHPDLGDWVYEVSGRGRMPGVMQEQRPSATVGQTSSFMFPFRNPFPESLLLSVILKNEEGPVGPVTLTDEGEDGAATGGEDLDRMSDEDGERGKVGVPTRKSPFTLLLKKSTDLVLQPFQSLQVPISFSPDIIVEERASVEVRGQLGGRALTWVFPLVGAAEAPASLRAFSLSCPAKTSVREYIEVELRGLAGVKGNEEFGFEVVLPEDPKLKRLLERALSVAPVNTILSKPQDLLRFQVSLEPLKPFHAVVELVVVRNTGGRWRYEIKLEATEPAPDDTISLQAGVGDKASVVFRLSNRYLSYAPFQAHFTTDSALSFHVDPSDGVLTPYGTEGTPLTVTYAPTQYAQGQRGRLIVETDDIRWSYEVMGAFPGFKAPSDVQSKVNTRLDPALSQRLGASSSGSSKVGSKVGSKKG
ncbi:unnamed protein product [Discosporangium mesarthrocarpum]